MLYSDLSLLVLLVFQRLYVLIFIVITNVTLIPLLLGVFFQHIYIVRKPIHVALHSIHTQSSTQHYHISLLCVTHSRLPTKSHCVLNWIRIRNAISIIIFTPFVLRVFYFFLLVVVERRIIHIVDILSIRIKWQYYSKTPISWPWFRHKNNWRNI